MLTVHRTYCVVLRLLYQISSHVKDVWMSESGTYPLVLTLGAAGVLCTYVGTRCLAVHPDVRISKQARKSIIRE